MRKFMLLALAACMMAAMAGCSGGNSAAEPTPTVAPTPTVTPQPVDFTISGPKANEGTVVNALAEMYMQDNGLNIQWKRTTVGTALAYTVTDKTDIALVTREIKQEELELYKDLKSTLLCTEALAVVVNTECPLDELSLEQLKEIYTGTLYDWSELGGSGVIDVYGTSGDESAGDAFQTLVLGVDDTGTQVTLDENVVNVVDTAEEMAQVIEGDALTIGFMPLKLAEKYNLKVLKIGGVAASEATVKDGAYPLQRPFYMVTVGDVADKVQAFIDYCTTDETPKKYLEELGYILP